MFDEQTLLVIAYIGAFTALFSATIALVQDDIKKVLAYSTVSQLGYMMLCARCGWCCFRSISSYNTCCKLDYFWAQVQSFTQCITNNQCTKYGGLYKKMPKTLRFVTYSASSTCWVSVLRRV